MDPIVENDPQIERLRATGLKRIEKPFALRRARRQKRRAVVRTVRVAVANVEHRVVPRREVGEVEARFNGQIDAARRKDTARGTARYHRTRYEKDVLFHGAVNSMTNRNPWYVPYASAEP